MRGAVIHGILLAIALVYGYRTWTRDKTVAPNIGSVVLWDRGESDLVSIEYTTDKKIVKIERKGSGAGAYWWGSDTTIEKKTVPVPPAAGSGSGSGSGSAGAGSGSAGSGSGSAAAKAEAAGSGSNAVAAGSGSAGAGSNAGSGSAAGSNGAGSNTVASGSGSNAGSNAGSAVAAGSGSAGSGAGSNVAAGSGTGSGSAVAAVPPATKEEITQKVHEFPLGTSGDDLVKGYLAARAVRELGTPSEKDLNDYKITGSKATITITFKSDKRTFTVGGSPYGSADKYVLDTAANKAYLLSTKLVSGLEIGETSLHLADPRGFDAAKVEAATIRAGERVKNAARIESKKDNTTIKTWADATDKTADQTLGNFIDAVGNLRPTEYSSTIKVGDLAAVIEVTYKDKAGGTLGTLAVFKREKVIPPGPDEAIDMAAPPKTETEYFVMSEKTKVPGLVRKDAAQRIEQDVPVIFGDRAAEPTPKITPKPGANPFGNTPLPKPAGSGAPAPSPHGADDGHGH